MSDQLTMSVGPAHATAIGIAGDLTTLPVEIGRASCRERVFSSV